MDRLSRLPWVWDYDLDASAFWEILEGRASRGRLDRDWAATRLLEYAPWADIAKFLGYRMLVEGWPRWRQRIRSTSRRRGLDFAVQWLSRYHPELLR